MARRVAQISDEEWVLGLGGFDGDYDGTGEEILLDPFSALDAEEICPKCHSRLHYIGGRYECEECGFTRRTARRDNE